MRRDLVGLTRIVKPDVKRAAGSNCFAFAKPMRDNDDTRDAFQNDCITLLRDSLRLGVAERAEN